MKKVLSKFPGYNFGKKSYFFAYNCILKARNKVVPTARIILYHRVAKLERDPYLLAVSPENFQEQIEYLKNNFRVVPLSELAKEVSSKKLVNNTAAITFDDGYSDNFHNAFPVLQRSNTPATIFITTDNIGKENFLGKGEIKKLTEAKDIIEIGVHTISHPRLSKVTPEEQEKEITKSKELLEIETGRPILSFAYPFGDKKSFDSDTVDLVKKAGYLYACANNHERITKNSDPFALPRFVARDWSLEEFKKELKKWI